MAGDEKLKDFSWDNWSESPLEEKETVEEVAPVVEEKEVSETEEVEKEVDPLSGEVKEEKEDISFEEDDFELEESNDGDDEDIQGESPIFSKLKEEGIFSLLGEDDLKDVSDEDVPELMDKEIDARVGEVMEGFFEELDEDAVAFLKFKQKGGSTDDFFKTYSKGSEIPQGDIDDEVYQEAVVRHGLQQEGMDSEEIQSRIDWLKEGSRMKKNAEKYEKKIDASTSKQKEEMLAQAEKADQRAREQRLELSENLKTKLTEVDSVGDFRFTKADKRNLHGYMTKPKVRVGKDNYMTQMQADLAKVFESPDKLLLMAKLLKSDFDVADVIRDTETKVTRKTKDKLERKSTSIKSSKSSHRGKKKALFEYFE